MLFKAMNCNKDKLLNCRGIDEDNLLKERSRDVNCFSKPSSEGIDPTREFMLRDNVCSAFRTPSDVGMIPVRFDCSDKADNPVNCERQLGIVPLRDDDIKERHFRELRRQSSVGIDPCKRPPDSCNEVKNAR